MHSNKMWLLVKYSLYRAVFIECYR